MIIKIIYYRKDTIEKILFKVQMASFTFDVPVLFFCQSLTSEEIATVEMFCYKIKNGSLDRLEH